MVSRKLVFWKLYSPSGRSGSGKDRSRCVVPDVVRPKQSADLWWRPPLRVEDGMAPPFGSLEEMMVRLGTHGTYPYPDSPLNPEYCALSDSGPIRSPGSIRGPRDRGLASPDPNRPGALPPHLRRAGPFRSSSGTTRPKAASLLVGTCSHWRILYEGHFTHYLVESSGWRSWWTQIEHPPGCSARRNHLLDFRQKILHHL